MDNLLRKQLSLIKARALRLRNRRESGEDDTRSIIDDVVGTGAVSRGVDFEPQPQKRRRPRRNSDDDGSAPSAENILARYKTGEPRPIEVVAPGEVKTILDFTTYLITARGRDVDPAASDEAERFRKITRWHKDVRYGTTAGKRPARRRGHPEPDIPFDPHRILFLDIETCGLSANTYLFLCGLMYMKDGEWVCEQVFARDYAEETGLLWYVHDMLERFDTVVTYNGASFDLPFIRTRMTVHRVGDIAPMGSVDLLYTTRRVYRGILPNRRLVTVERHLRRVDREGDIPGRYIPDAYHDYVRTGDARVMRNVLYHNRMDLFTMAVIITRLPGG